MRAVEEPCSLSPEPRSLSPEHRRMLEEESCISPEVIAARGYYTAYRRAEVPDVFSEKQRKLGLVVPLYSPDGETMSYQLRPNKRRHKGGKYLTPRGVGNIVDVHPFMRDAIKDASVPLYLTEGARTGDSLVSRGRCTAIFAGVYNFAVPGTCSEKLLPCFDHIPLRGRLVYVLYDADARTNKNVQEALRRLVARLEERGARVLVIYVPAVNGDGKAGVDDYLAAGGELEDLEQSAQPYEPVDVAAERLSRDEKLRAALEERSAYLRGMPLKTIRQNTAAAVARVLTEEAAQSGEVVEDGIRVEMDRRTLASLSARSLRSTHKAIEYLEVEERTLRRDNQDRPSHKRGAFVLLTGRGGRELGKQYGEGERLEEGDSQERESFSPLSNAAFPPGVYPTRSPSAGEVPALRWPKVIHWRGRKNGRSVVVGSHYVWRLGEKRGQILRHILEAGGWVPEEELMTRFAGVRTRPRDFRRWTLGPLTGWRYQKDRVTGEITAVRVGEPIVELDYTPEGVYVRARPNWREVLEEYRERTEEIADAERQRKRYAEQRRKYRRRHEHPAEEEPELMGRERVGEILEERRKDEERRWIEGQREKVGTTAAVFLSDELEGVSGVRWRELRARWIERGGKAEDLQRAVRYGPFRFEREAIDRNDLYVYPGTTGSTQEAPATVAPLYRPAETPSTITEAHTEQHSPARPYKRPDGVYIHPADCGCEWCAEDIEPSCASLQGVS